MQHLVIGLGRVGQSMAAYARHLGCEVETLGRDDILGGVDVLRRAAAAADVIAIATPDDVIAEVRAAIGSAAAGKAVVHFSGALIVGGAHAVHPLCSFPKEAMSPEALARAPFGLEPGGPPFDEIYPGATNPTFNVRSEDRAFYHAIAVLCANYPAHIWNACAGAFAERFPDAPPDALATLLESCVDRFRESPLSSMTGPVAREDRSTVAANRTALAEAPPLMALYDAFLASAWPEALPQASKRGGE